ncbi:hypothetical protein PR048_024972 [Dryococelus australis]|uniref:DNA helicase Pif1-like 2B domain-containing protein n=1 Tax=Dryococelus australis TaxID=614101 RepID=A0ABQ9GQ23_9NEOP|nr:hypothetical protein PR048_024972 [Dryococelus australis]
MDVNELNFEIQNEIAGELRTYKSVDSATNQDDVNYSPEFLNSLDLPGLPPHNLQLKVGSVIIMLRNINQPCLCNGTRLAVKKLLNNVIEATILKGKYKGEDVLIPRVPMIPTDLPFEFKRLQFPVRLAFAMTINKSQGQSFSVCGINLENPCFTHGQLYVACSRVGKPSDLFVYAPALGRKHCTPYAPRFLTLDAQLHSPLKVRGNLMMVEHLYAFVRLHHRGSKLDPRSDLRSTQKPVAPLEFRAGLKIEMKLISNCRNWRFEISIGHQQPSSTNIDESEIQNHEISLVQLFYIGTKIKLDSGSELGSFYLGSGKMMLQPDTRRGRGSQLKNRDGYSEGEVNYNSKATEDCNIVRMRRLPCTAARWSFTQRRRERREKEIGTYTQREARARARTHALTHAHTHPQTLRTPVTRYLNVSSGGKSVGADVTSRALSVHHRHGGIGEAVTPARSCYYQSLSGLPWGRGWQRGGERVCLVEGMVEVGFPSHSAGPCITGACGLHERQHRVPDWSSSIKLRALIQNDQNQLLPLIASHQGELGLIPGGFSRGSPVSPAPPRHSGPAPVSPLFTLIGSQDLVWLDYSPPTKVNRVRFPTEPPGDFHMRESGRTMTLVGGFSRGSPVPPPLHSGAPPSLPHFPLAGDQDQILRT